MADADPKTQAAPSTTTPSWESEQWRRMNEENDRLRCENADLAQRLKRSDKMQPRPTTSGAPPFIVKE